MGLKGRPKQDFLIQLPDCPVCWDGFDDGPRMPRLLHCGHTNCQVCLGNLLFESSLGQRCVRCPECCGVCVWRGLHALPKNYILLRVLSSSSPTESPIELPNLPLISQMSRLLFHLIEHIPGMIERKLWDLGKLSWASAAMVVFLPFSFVHMVVAWLTAGFGSLVFVWFSLGGLGIALFMLSTWLCYNIAQFVIEIGLGQFLNQIRHRAPSLGHPDS